MLNMEEWTQIRHLQSQGMSVRAIARRLSLSRDTVAKYLRAERPPQYVRRQSRDITLLNPFIDYLKGRLEDYPELTAARLYREIRDRGYVGSCPTIRRFVRPLRAAREVPAVYRFETPPGLQAQVDWALFGRIEVDGRRYPLAGFLMTLGYSRAKFVEFVTDLSTPTFLACHEHAFSYFDGYTREILYDNLKSVVLRRAYLVAESQFNPLYLDFAAYYGITPRLCAPYRARTKGKVENTVKFVRKDFFEGRHFSSLDELNHEAQRWCNEVNQRIHGTTRVPPIERFATEQLVPLSSHPPYPIRRSFTRKISRDCFVNFLGNRYSVPWKYATREATLRLEGAKLEVEVGGDIVCRHDLLVGNGHVVQVEGHRAGLLAAIRRRLQVRQARLESFVSLPDVPDVQRRELTVYDKLMEERA